MENQTLQAEPAVNAKSIAIKNGLIWTVINIFLFLGVYYAAPTLMASFAFGMISLLLSIGLAIYFTLDIRKKTGGYWSFKEAVSAIFVLFIVQIVIYTCFVTAFSKWIEPSYADFTRETGLNAATEMYENITTDQEMIDQMIADTERRIEKQVNPTLGEFIQGLAIWVIVYFVFALIFAAIFKRNRPYFAPIVEDEIPSDERID